MNKIRVDRKNKTIPLIEIGVRCIVQILGREMLEFDEED
jgi:hypothetical protein